MNELDDDGTTGRGIDAKGWEKIGKGAGIAGAGIGAGTVTGVGLVQVAIEQGLISPTMPSEQPASFGVILAIASLLWSVAINSARKWWIKYPAS